MHEVISAGRHDSRICTKGHLLPYNLSGKPSLLLQEMVLYDRIGCVWEDTTLWWVCSGLSSCPLVIWTIWSSIHGNGSLEGLFTSGNYGDRCMTPFLTVRLTGLFCVYLFKQQGSSSKWKVTASCRRATARVGLYCKWYPRRLYRKVQRWTTINYWSYVELADAALWFVYRTGKFLHCLSVSFSNWLVFGC